MERAIYDRDVRKEDGKEDCRQGLLSWVPLVHQTVAPAKQDHPCAFPKVGRNDGREPRAVAMSNHCFVWCQMPRVTRLLEDGEQGESLQDLTCGVAVRRTANSSATTLL